MATTFTMCDFFAEGQYIHKDLKKRCFLIIDLRDFYVQEHTYTKKIMYVIQKDNGILLIHPMYEDLSYLFLK